MEIIWMTSVRDANYVKIEGIPFCSRVINRSITNHTHTACKDKSFAYDVCKPCKETHTVQIWKTMKCCVYGMLIQYEKGIRTKNKCPIP